MLNYTQEFDKAEDAIDAANSYLEDLEEQLEEALTPTDDETLHDLFAKTEVAYYTLEDAQRKYDALVAELERLEPELEADRLEAQQALAVARESLEVADNNLFEAEETLADIHSGPSDQDITIAFANVQKAETDLIQAIKDLDELQESTSPEITVLNTKISAAQADIQLELDKSKRPRLRRRNTNRPSPIRANLRQTRHERQTNSPTRPSLPRSRRHQSRPSRSHRSKGKPIRRRRRPKRPHQPRSRNRRPPTRGSRNLP